MKNSAYTLYCAGLSCQSPNPAEAHECRRCGLPLVRRPLWAVGLNRPPSTPLLGERYFHLKGRLFLDTTPALPVETPPQIPPPIEAYLRLLPLRLHLSQVHSCLTLPGRQTVWFLEQGPFTIQGLRPCLVSKWSATAPRRQLSWLRQIASLWEPFAREGVVNSLLEPELLRVEGPLVRLLELRLDEQSPSLERLGVWWSSWVEGADPEVKTCLSSLAEQVRAGCPVSDLLGALDEQLAVGTEDLHVELFNRTDPGPSRAENEDACYPAPGEHLRGSPPFQAIVCDGVGGHAGGEVASGLAITSLRETLNCGDVISLDSSALVDRLQQAVTIANNLICEQNDREQRQERQRMGTTLVMATVRDREVYLTHVGDSRAYLILPQGCYPLTVDDDIASREVRLGYTLYRDVSQFPASGALTQALGTGPGDLLVPSVERLALDDEDYLLLLCSDGLSDNDLVEIYWSQVLLPVLEGTITLAEAADQLVYLANTRNGHDNTTVSLIYCQRGGVRPISPHLVETSLDLVSTRQPWLWGIVSLTVLAGLGLLGWGMYTWRQPSPPPPTRPPS